MARRPPMPLLSEAVPALAVEVEQLLRKEGEDTLASQIRELRVKSRCNCRQDNCATIYTGPGRPKYSVPLDESVGILVVDVDDRERIVGIEILDRPEYKTAIDALFSTLQSPAHPSPLPPGEGRAAEGGSG